MMDIRFTGSQNSLLVWVLKQGPCWIREGEWPYTMGQSGAKTVNALVRKECLELGEKDGKRRWRLTGRGREVALSWLDMKK